MDPVTIHWYYGMIPFNACVTPGTKVNFWWRAGTRHNVVKITGDTYGDCSGAYNEEFSHDILEYTWTAPANAMNHYFVCGVSYHCGHGNMKARIRVSETC